MCVRVFVCSYVCVFVLLVSPLSLLFVVWLFVFVCVGFGVSACANTVLENQQEHQKIVLAGEWPGDSATAISLFSSAGRREVTSLRVKAFLSESTQTSTANMKCPQATSWTSGQQVRTSGKQAHMQPVALRYASCTIALRI